MKHYILVSITIPEKTEHEQWRAWLGFLHSHQAQSKPTEGIERLAENVWLLQRANSASVLASVVHDVEQIRLPYKVQFLREDV